MMRGCRFDFFTIRLCDVTLDANDRVRARKSEMKGDFRIGSGPNIRYVILLCAVTDEDSLDTLMKCDENSREVALVLTANWRYVSHLFYVMDTKNINFRPRRIHGMLKKRLELMANPAELQVVEQKPDERWVDGLISMTVRDGLL